MSPKKSVAKKFGKSPAAKKMAKPARKRSGPVKKSRPAGSAKAASAKTDRRAAWTKRAAPKPQARPKKKMPRRAAPASKTASRTDKTPGSKARLVESAARKGLGAAAAGQSGDVEGLSTVADADSESVTELVEE